GRSPLGSTPPSDPATTGARGAADAHPPPTASGTGLRRHRRNRLDVLPEVEGKEHRPHEAEGPRARQRVEPLRAGVASEAEGIPETTPNVRGLRSTGNRGGSRRAAIERWTR